MMYHPRQSSRKESTLQRIARVAVGVSLAVMVCPSGVERRRRPEGPGAADRSSGRARADGQIQQGGRHAQFPSSWIDGFGGGRQGDIIRRFNDIIRRLKTTSLGKPTP
jgi:hypothetical protein